MSETPIVFLRLYASLARYVPSNPDAYPIHSGSSIHQLVAALGIPPEEVKLVFVDGRKEGLDFRLAGGERIGLFPPVGGG